MHDTTEPHERNDQASASMSGTAWELQYDGAEVPRAIISSIWVSVYPHLTASVRAWLGVNRPYQRPYMIVAVRLLALNCGGGVSDSRRIDARNPFNQCRRSVSMRSALESDNGCDQRAGRVDFPFVKPCKPGSVASHGSPLFNHPGISERVRPFSMDPEI